MRAEGPIIIIGMHRSGTSMLVRALETLGLFMGVARDRYGNDEAALFLNLNKWLLRLSGAAWDNPQPVHSLRENAELSELAVGYLRYVLRTPWLATYLGPLRYVRYRRLERLDFAWGWKDPRNTYTLPLWLHLFPGASVIHVCRHGVDVAGSLRTREHARLGRAKARYANRLGRLRLYGLPFGRFGSEFTDAAPSGSPRCASLEGGFSLWEAYVDEARSQLAKLSSRALEVRYEDFVLEPLQHLKALADFCGLEASSAQVRRAADGLHADRAYAYRRDQELVAFAGRVTARLNARGFQSGL